MAEENVSSADSASSSSPNLTKGVKNNPNQRLCSVLLNEFNYLPWSRAVSLALGGRSKLGFINGSFEPLESTSPIYDGDHIEVCETNLALIPNYHILAKAPTTSRARLRRSTILSALGPDHTLMVLFLGTHTRTSLWVTYHGIAHARTRLSSEFRWNPR
ncbi:hypothetical protein DVH24_025480 [Malus domestica]|uniref:Retrotransposon Copia-like N-terminal domain-containing protein n=1 Tax=Malus domestica TaxID=3750 RepID=A0A498HM13_MALDO|nr:hypothetical protein DVH24_025480 [Malus domestica]